MNIIDKTNTTNVEKLRENIPKSIIIHSTKRYSTFEDLYNLHVGKNQWYGVGYHIFIDASNKVYLTRPLNKEGAHAWGFNLDSIGFCIYNGNQGSLKHRLEVGTDVLSYLRSELGNLPVMSHTLAQIEYINKLLGARGLDKIQESENFMHPKKFQSLENMFHTSADLRWLQKEQKFLEGLKI
jgi:hypothetical protein